MKKLLFATALFAVSLLLMQCRAKRVKSSTMPEGDFRKIYTVAKKRWPDIKPADLDSGRVIYTTKCTRCHGMKSITARNEVTWKSEIAKMAPKAKLKEEQKELLTRYILSSREAGVN